MNFVQSHKAPPPGSPSSQSSREVKNLINRVGAAHQGAERRAADQGPAQDVSLAASGIPTAETAQASRKERRLRSPVECNLCPAADQFNKTNRIITDKVLIEPINHHSR